MLAAAAAAAFSSCSKEVAPVEGSEGISFTVVADANATKTVLDGLTPKWVDGDAIGLSKGSVNVKFEETSIPDGGTASTASFSGTVTDPGEYFAYYPYSTLGYNLLAGGPKIEIPAVQNPTLNSFDGAADILGTARFNVAEDTDEVTGLSFNRLTSVVKLVFKDPSSLLGGEKIQQASIESNSNPFAGIVGITGTGFNGDSMTDASKSKTITAEYAEADQFAVNGTNAVWFSVYPATHFKSNLVLRSDPEEWFDGKLVFRAVTASYKVEKEVDIASNIVLAPGKVTTFNVTIEAGNVSSNTSVPAPVINAADPEVVAAAGGSASITYSIDNPVAGKSISAVSDESWVSGFDYSVDGTVSFTVGANTGAARSAKVTLSYEGAADVDVTVSQAAYVASTPAVYKKVTSNLADFSGKYLIVYEDEGLVFNGGADNSEVRIDRVNNMVVEIEDGDTVPVEFSITGGVITLTEDSYYVTLESAGEGKYLIKTNSGFYLYAQSDANLLQVTEDATLSHLPASVSINDDGSAQIASVNGPVLRYNANAGQYRFRFYKTSSYTGQKAVALYKFSDGSEPVAPVINVSEPDVVASSGGEVSVTYTVDNPVAGKTVSAVAADGWVNGFDYSTAGTIKFNVDANSGEARSTKVTVSYDGAADVDFTVSQLANTVSGFTYKKVTSTLADFSGKYLIVYEDEGLVFNGGADNSAVKIDRSKNMVVENEDSDKDPVSFSITGGVITLTEDSYYVTLESAGEGKYLIKTNSGFYLYAQSDANLLQVTEDATLSHLPASVSINDDGSAQIASVNGPVLRYNANAGQYRFRFYKTSSYTGQKAVALYKFVE